MNIMHGLKINAGLKIKAGLRLPSPNKRRDRQTAWWVPAERRPACVPRVSASTAARETRTVGLSRASSSASRSPARAHATLSRICLCLLTGCCSMPTCKPPARRRVDPQPCPPRLTSSVTSSDPSLRCTGAAVAAPTHSAQVTFADQQK